jgi:uncharacterized membrane protein YjgN (DUF898 family)
MENTTSLRDLLHDDSTQQSYRILFLGKGSEYFSVVIVNWLLTAITFGIYYPWAKARQLQYLYSSTDFQGARFIFHGTGAEMFKGFIKAILIFVCIMALFFFFMWMNMPITGIIVFYMCFLSIIPIAIHGSYRYRMSRTSWRGIRFGYRGDQKELYILFFKNLFLTLITLFIYGAWAAMNLRNYVLNRVKFGNLKFNYKGSGKEFFILNLKGYLLSILTLFIYSFWWQKDLFAYYVNNLSVTNENGEEIKLKTNATGGDFFGLIISNIFIIIFTLGIGYAWVVVRTMKFIFAKIELQGNIDLDRLVQSEENYADATGEDLSDMIDLGFII